MEAPKRKRLKKLIIWLSVDLVVLVVVLGLLLHRPSRYEPFNVDSVDQGQRQVHHYFTHLSSELYNGAQRDEPFELVVVENGINESIAGWSVESESIGFSAPAVLFVPDSIVLMGTVNLEGAKFVVSIVIVPIINEQGFLNLHVEKVKVGAMSITPIAKLVAEKMYQRQFKELPIDADDLRTQIAASLLKDQVFEPVFKIDDRNVRLEKILITNGKLKARLAPAL